MNGIRKVAVVCVLVAASLLSVTRTASAGATGTTVAQQTNCFVAIGAEKTNGVNIVEQHRCSTNGSASALAAREGYRTIARIHEDVGYQGEYLDIVVRDLGPCDNSGYFVSMTKLGSLWEMISDWWADNISSVSYWEGSRCDAMTVTSRGGASYHQSVPDFQIVYMDNVESIRFYDGSPFADTDIRA
jgi:hypothetical protein